jgi:hypothetical protein
VPAQVLLVVGAEIGMRHFSDDDPGDGAPRTYTARPVPGFFLDAEWYPMFAGHFGIGASVARSVGVRSITEDRTTVSTTFTRAEGSLRGRIFAGSAEPSWLTVFAGYRWSDFSFGSAPDGREIPTGRYHILRAGLDARLPLAWLIVSAGAEYDRLVSIADLGDTSAPAPGNGLVAHLGAGVPIAPWLGARLDAAYTFYTFRVDREVSARVNDHYAIGSLALEASF